MTNTGARRGAEVVQCYVAPREPSVTRPAKELKAFAKVWLEPGETTTVTLDARRPRLLRTGNPRSTRHPSELPGHSIPSADPARHPTPDGASTPGTYSVVIGTSSAHIVHRHELEVVRP